MNKEEIIESNNFDTDYWNYYHTTQVLEAMEQYKNQELKAILLFIKENNLIPVYTNWKYAYTGEFINDTELLDKFLKEKE